MIYLTGFCEPCQVLYIYAIGGIVLLRLYFYVSLGKNCVNNRSKPALFLIPQYCGFCAVVILNPCVEFFYSAVCSPLFSCLEKTWAQFFFNDHQCMLCI